jgi:predicted DNA-binding protein
MAKKRVAKVEEVKAERNGKPVRLDLPDPDFERLERVAKHMGLTKASYARMAVLERIRADEAKIK